MSQEQHQEVADALRDWWEHTTQADIDRVVPKAVEYGSTDLSEIGRTMGQIMGREGLSHEEATEIGIYFYMVGKMARWTDAVKNGRRPSRDTIFDMKIYATMAERNLDVGGWPFAPTIEAEDMG